MGNPFKDFKYYPTSMKVGLLLGVSLTLLVVGLIAYRALLAEPWVPKVRYHDKDIIDVYVCGHELKEVVKWGADCPCEFEFTELDDSDVLCHPIGEVDYNVIVDGDPDAVSTGSGAVTNYWVKPILWQWMAPDAGQGKPGPVAIGRSHGTIITAKKGVSTLFGRHELCVHVCGYEHAYQSKGSSIFMNLHLASPKSKTIGTDMRGMDMSATMYDKWLLEEQ